MKVVKKRLLPALLALLLLAGLAGCGKAEAPLPEGFDAETLEQTAVTVIDLLVAGDYEGVWALFNADMQALLPAEKLRETLTPTFEKLGAFERYGNYQLVTTHDETLGDYVTVLVATKFAKGHTTFRISVDKDGLLCGLYM